MHSLMHSMLKVMCTLISWIKPKLESRDSLRWITRLCVLCDEDNGELSVMEIEINFVDLNQFCVIIWY